MSQNRWATLDRWMRSIHLYSGLFLVPWMLVYAASATLLNHGNLVRETFGVTPPQWKMVQRVAFVPNDDFPELPKDQAHAILKRLDLDGPHRIQGKPTPRGFTILRISGSGHYRVRWEPRKQTLIVEKQQPFSFFRLVHFLHFRAGFNQPYWAMQLWAVLVDVVAAFLVFWVVSGVYIWARRPRKRALGGVFLAAGLLLFAGLVTLLCM